MRPPPRRLKRARPRPQSARPPKPQSLQQNQVTCDDFFSGQAAALAGGTTMHIDFALPIDHDLLAGWEEWRNKAQARWLAGCWG